MAKKPNKHRLVTVPSFFSTGSPHNGRHNPKLRRHYDDAFSRLSRALYAARMSRPDVLEPGNDDSITFQAFAAAFIDDFGVANLLFAIAATFHDRAEAMMPKNPDMEPECSCRNRNLLSMWANRIGALAHEMFADDAAQDMGIG